MVTLPVELYSDGSSIRNPGASGLGWVLRYYEQEEEDSIPKEVTLTGSEGYRLSTNNRMELMAFIVGARKFIELHEDLFANVTQLNVFSDSDYLVKAINQNWLNKWEQTKWMTSGYQGSKPKPVKNKDLWKMIQEIQGILRSKSILLTMTHVDGHSGVELNETADKLATSASSQKAVQIDEEYEKYVSHEKLYQWNPNE